MVKKSLFIVVVGFFAGYLSNHLLHESVAGVQIVKSIPQDCEPSPVLADTVAVETSLSQLTASASSLESLLNAAVPQKNSNTINAKTDAPVDEPQAEKIPVIRMGSNDVKKEDVITDAEIDAVIPAPFNDQLKGMQGYFRDKYKEFAAAEQGDDWDIKMKAYIEDSIYSNPYGKDLIVESLVCKIGICEMLLYETKKGAWSFIHAEMGLQSWWDIGESSSSGFSTQRDGKNITAHYVLMSRKSK